MKKILLALIAAIILGGCVDVTLDSSSVCNTTNVGEVMPTPLNVPLPPQTFTSSLDVSGVVNQTTSVFDTVQLIVTQLTLDSTADLSWLKRVDVSIDGGTPSTSEAPLASYQSNGGANSSVAFQMQMDSDTLLVYLANPVTLTFTVTGNPTSTAAGLSNTVCVDIKGNIKKSL